MYLFYFNQWICYTLYSYGILWSSSLIIIIFAQEGILIIDATRWHLELHRQLLSDLAPWPSSFDYRSIQTNLAPLSLIITITMEFKVRIFPDEISRSKRTLTSVPNTSRRLISFPDLLSVQCYCFLISIRNGSWCPFGAIHFIRDRIESWCWCLHSEVNVDMSNLSCNMKVDGSRFPLLPRTCRCVEICPRNK